MVAWLERLHTGDCVKGLNRLDRDAVRVDMAFADPPYNIGYSYDLYVDRLDSPTYLRWTREWMGAVNRVLKPTGALWVAIGDEYVGEVKTIAERLGLTLRNWVVWYYTFGVHCTRKFSRSHTHLLYLVKDPQHFTFNDHSIRVPSARQLVYNDGRADRRGRVPDNTWILRPQDSRDAFGADHDTWYFPRVAGTFKERAGFHGCQIPEQLLGRIILCSTNPGDVVLDPFAGSASSLVVAKKLGRRWVGYELSPDYARHGNARISFARAGDSLEGQADPLASAPVTPPNHEWPDERGIVEAFRQASGGYASDRVIADPVLNAAFIERCSALSLVGRPSDWNLALLAVRKSGKLARVPASKRTQFSWRDLDPFLFASEIALRQMLDRGYPSLDFVLCDPLAAARFDDLARSLAPGFTSLQYRWAALRLRKDARLWRRSSEKVGESALSEKPRRVGLDEARVAKLGRVPGVYLLSTATRERREASPAYIGETCDLGGRARTTLSALFALDHFVPNTGEWELGLFVRQGEDRNRRRGLQSLLIGRSQPVMNYLELGSRMG